MQQSLGLSHNASPDSNNGCKEDHGNQDTKAKGKTNLAGPHQSKIIKKKNKTEKRKETNRNKPPAEWLQWPFLQTDQNFCHIHHCQRVSCFLNEVLHHRKQ